MKAAGLEPPPKPDPPTAEEYEMFKNGFAVTIGDRHYEVMGINCKRNCSQGTAYSKFMPCF